MLEEKHEAKLEFPGSGGGGQEGVQNKKTFHMNGFSMKSPLKKVPIIPQLFKLIQSLFASYYRITIQRPIQNDLCGY